MAFNRPISNRRPEPKSSSGLATLVEAEKLMQIAILLPSSAFIGWLLGAWLDSRFHQSWLGIAGIVVGGVSGLVYVIRLAIASMNGVRITSKKGSRTEKGISGK
jgi:F0F1-type ATP synthase assembly protein I